MGRWKGRSRVNIQDLEKKGRGVKKGNAIDSKSYQYFNNLYSFL